MVATLPGSSENNTYGNRNTQGTRVATLPGSSENCVNKSACSVYSMLQRYQAQARTLIDRDADLDNHRLQRYQAQARTSRTGGTSSTWTPSRVATLPGSSENNGNVLLENRNPVATLPGSSENKSTSNWKPPISMSVATLPGSSENNRTLPFVLLLKTSCNATRLKREQTQAPRTRNIKRALQRYHAQARTEGFLPRHFVLCYVATLPCSSENIKR